MTPVRWLFQPFQSAILLADGTRAALKKWTSARPAGSSAISYINYTRRQKGEYRYRGCAHPVFPSVFNVADEIEIELAEQRRWKVPRPPRLRGRSINRSNWTAVSSSAASASWFNGHPDYRHRTFDLSQETVLTPAEIALDVGGVYDNKAVAFDLPSVVFGACKVLDLKSILVEDVKALCSV
jgi:hypothetical protein